MNEAVVKSVETNAKVIFSDIDGDYFTVRYESPNLTLSKRVWGYTDCSLLVQLFEYMAKNWKGWEDSEGWASIEDEFRVSGTSDSLGHIELALFFQENDGPETWTVETSLKLETGVMESIAKQVSIFFRGSNGL